MLLLFASNMANKRAPNKPTPRRTWAMAGIWRSPLFRFVSFGIVFAYMYGKRIFFCSFHAPCGKKLAYVHTKNSNIRVRSSGLIQARMEEDEQSRKSRDELFPLERILAQPVWMSGVKIFFAKQF